MLTLNLNFMLYWRRGLPPQRATLETDDDSCLSKLDRLLSREESVPLYTHVSLVHSSTTNRSPGIEC